jgi:hypothetical protein
VNLEEAAKSLAAFERGALTTRLALLEAAFAGADPARSADLCASEALDDTLLQSALTFKKVAGQINVIVHAVGILLALPKVLEPGERVEYLSLGAGNTGREFDLETDRRIAEFKFIRWQGGPEAIRQNSLFKDFFGLAEADGAKRRCLYVLGRDIPLVFLNGGRALTSVMSRNAGLNSRFRELYGERFDVVRNYYAFRRDRVELVDLLPLVPSLGSLPQDDDVAA